MTTHSSPSGRAPERPATFCFTVTAEADPGLLPRLVGAFSRRGLVPGKVHAVREAREPSLSVDLQIADLLPAEADLLAADFRAMVGVSTVLVAAKAEARPASVAA
jgi:acetolactate synthase regulatory subunit